MSLYLEIAGWAPSFPFRTFKNVGEMIVTKASVNTGYEGQMIQVHEGDIFVFGSGESH